MSAVSATSTRVSAAATAWCQVVSNAVRSGVKDVANSWTRGPHGVGVLGAGGTDQLVMIRHLVSLPVSGVVRGCGQGTARRSSEAAPVRPGGGAASARARFVFGRVGAIDWCDLDVWATRGVLGVRATPLTGRRRCPGVDLVGVAEVETGPALWHRGGRCGPRLDVGVFRTCRSVAGDRGLLGVAAIDCCASMSGRETASGSRASRATPECTQPVSGWASLQFSRSERACRVGAGGRWQAIAAGAVRPRSRGCLDVRGPSRCQRGGLEGEGFF